MPPGTAQNASPAGVVTVTDPDTGATVELEVWKDRTTGGMFAVDATYLDQVRQRITSPFGHHRLQLVGPEDSPAPTTTPAVLRRVIYTFEVLVEPGVDAASWGFADINYQISEGAAVGHFIAITDEDLSKDEADAACGEHDVDPSWFRYGGG